MAMANRIADLERRMLRVESELGLAKIDPNEEEKKYLRNLLDENEKRIEDMDRAWGKKKPKPDPEQIINGYPKSQLLIMFAWARNLKLNQLTKNDFEELKKWGVLKDFYPDAPDNYGDIIL